MRLLLVLLLPFLCALRATAAESKPITATVGQQFEIVLDSPGDSDRQWLLCSPLDETLLKASGREYRKSTQPTARGKTFEVLRYKALAPGKAEIHLKFAALFAQNEAAAVRTNFVVIITEPHPKAAR
jgi:hypothetical protein